MWPQWPGIFHGFNFPWVEFFMGWVEFFLRRIFLSEIFHGWNFPLVESSLGGIIIGQNFLEGTFPWMELVA